MDQTMKPIEIEVEEDLWDQSSKLLNKVVELIKADPRTPAQLYRASGVPIHWINGLLYKTTKNPSASRLEYMYEFLTGKTLEF